MKRNTMLHTLGCAIIAAATFAVLPAMAQRNTPNVVFILLDNVYNIEMDPHEDLNIAGLFGWTGLILGEVEKYLATLKKYPNPPAANITQFRSRSD